MARMKMPDPRQRPHGFETEAEVAEMTRHPPVLKPTAPRRAVRVGHSVTLPDYVWRWLKEESFKQDMPKNVIIMKALKAAGAPIEKGDLVDGRKVR